jgi:hypothetical protein
MRADARLLVQCTLWLLPACTTPQPALLGRFETTLSAHDSATAALEQWCAVRRMADPARILAKPAGGKGEPSQESRELLEAGPDVPVGYRHVRLTCGGQVLSDAHNWYVPSRLTAEMNHALATTDAPFGKVVAPLGFTRERLAGERGASKDCPTDTILSHRALLRLPDGRPISFVIECYTPANLR